MLINIKVITSYCNYLFTFPCTVIYLIFYFQLNYQWFIVIIFPIENQIVQHAITHYNIMKKDMQISL